MFILVHDLSSKSQPNYIWYLCGVEYYSRPDSDWILQSTDYRSEQILSCFM